MTAGTTPTHSAAVQQFDTLSSVWMHMTNDADAVNVILSDYPLVWGILVEGVEDDGNDNLTSQADDAFRNLALRVAEHMYGVIFGDIDNRHIAESKTQEMLEWILEGDLGIPGAETNDFVAEWREYDADDIGRLGLTGQDA